MDRYVRTCIDLISAFIFSPQCFPVVFPAHTIPLFHTQIAVCFGGLKQKRLTTGVTSTPEATIS